ncbi:glutathione S-transferase family protein [Pseudomonadales bacterium]|jgi:glutathione S-transferase|nr:glutathione S-transferase family protein [Pseudomonadales bacterium]MDC1314218.1 glutathione S-transferase family protein [Pseudomonadales bacterium]
MALTLYHVPGARSLRVIWLCLELDLPLTIETIDFSPKFRDSEGWRALSPTGKVPVLRDDGFTMFESGAMLQYLLDAYGAGQLQPAAGTQAAAMFQQWSWFAEATFARPLGDIAQHTVVRPEAQRIPAVVDDARQRASICLQALEVGMGAGPYLLGNAFTAADVNMGYSLVLAERFGLIEPGLSRVVSYFDGLKTRPHFLKALTL